jgi:hypothetical protein
VRLGNYEVVRHLGAGGMSTVWLARGPVPATLTAPASAHGLVVLKQQMRAEDDDLLREEARVGAKLRHAGVVQTLACFDDDSGRPVLALEYVAGAALAHLRKRGPLPTPAVCRIGADVAEALGALHDAGILHRDVTPANIIVSHDGSARLIDLGIARASESTLERTATGTVRGTLRYVAPQLFEGAQHDAGADLWSLGVCLFEAALGRPAVTGPEALVLAAVVRGQLLHLQPSEHLDPLLQEVIARLCTRERAHRYGDARAAALRLNGGDLGDGSMLASVAVYAAVDEPRNEAVGAARSDARAAAHTDGMLRRDVVPARVAPAAASDDNGFARMAASTYCGGDDDDPFAEASQASTIITTSAREDVLVPAPITIFAEGAQPLVAAREIQREIESAPELAPTMPYGVRAPAFDAAHIEAPPTTPGTPGGVRRGPAPGDAWEIPQPITGEDDAGSGVGAASSHASPLMDSSSQETEPLPRSPHTAPTVDELPQLPHAQLAPPFTPRGATAPGFDDLGNNEIGSNEHGLDDQSQSPQLVDLRAHAIGAPSLIAIVVIVACIAIAAFIAFTRM